VGVGGAARPAGVTHQRLQRDAAGAGVRRERLWAGFSDHPEMVVAPRAASPSTAEESPAESSAAPAACDIALSWQLVLGMTWGAVAMLLLARPAVGTIRFHFRVRRGSLGQRAGAGLADGPLV